MREVVSSTFLRVAPDFLIRAIRYASMNGAIEVFIKYLAKELGPKDIGANVVAQGPVDTDFNNAAIRNNPQMKAALSSISPLGRVGVVDDIGSVRTPYLS